MKRLSLVLLVTALMSHTAFASYEKALECFQQKNYEGSLKIVADDLIVENDFKEGSVNYKLRYLAAHNHWKLGNKEPVIAHFKRCMDIKKDTADPYIDLSLFLTEINRLNDAETIAQNGLKIKQAPMLYYVLGKISLLKGNFWRAKEHLEQANSMREDCYFSYNLLGVALMNIRKFSEANTAFTIAAALNPASPQVLNNLGISYESLGKYDKAYECLEQASLLDKENKTILDNVQKAKNRKK